MKHEIVCTNHTTFETKIGLVAKEYDELFVVVKGKALTDCRCDLCDRVIPQNAECHAWTMGGPTDVYRPWEHRRILITHFPHEQFAPSAA